MLANILSAGLTGLNGFLVHVEVDLSSGIPHYELVGLPGAVVKESKERIRAGIKNSGFSYPNSRLTLNLAPADIKKEGPLYDLPIAVAILAVSKQIDLSVLKDAAFLGELSLNGDIRPVHGILPMVLSLKEQGVATVVLPYENGKEASYVPGINILPVKNLKELVAYFKKELTLSFLPNTSFSIEDSNTIENDLAFIKGQANAKRALEIAVAGGHNILFIGPPGSGKSMLARAAAGILPALTFEEALEISMIHSVSGKLKSGIIAARPFESPHHSASTPSLTGGGINARPGEVSLSHNGVLFLDELPEFSRSALEALRQPLEDGFVSISRVNTSVRYPAKFMLIASMNPCPCGHYGDGTGKCKCTPLQIHNYLSKISGPLLDRIDLHIEVSPVPYSEISSNKHEESSLAVRARVNAAREIQLKRYQDTGIFFNSRLKGKLFEQYCALDSDAQDLIKMAFSRLGLSARSYSRILMVSRTIADLAECEHISAEHIAEAIQYRSLDRKYWGE